jgi:hypothetical protein
MALEAELIAAVGAFKRLMELQNPDLVQYWRPPPSLRAEYVQLAESVVYALDRLKAAETEALHADARVESRLPAEVLKALREEIRQKEPSLWDALDLLDPDNKLLRELMVFQTRPAGRGGNVRSTFEQGLEEVEDLIARNPDRDFAWLHPDLALEVLNSKLIAFEPDAWLDRIAELAPVRTAAERQALPSHIRLRLRELFQVYTFGCWFSALSAARATLEYALQDSAGRFGLQTTSEGNQSDRTPSLYRLIELYATRIPGISDSMHRVRRLGNLSLHAEVSADLSPTSTMRARYAAEAITLVTEILERLYLHGET